MGVYIKDMNMPTSCGDCPCAHIFDGYKCMAAKRPFDKYPLDNRMDWCPLIPVPPHGRLIDADALVKKQPIPELGAPRWLIEQAPTIIESEGADERTD